MLGVGRILELHRPARRFRPSRIRPVPPGRHWCPRAPRRCRRARPRHRRIGCRCHGWRRNCRRQPPCHCRFHCPRRRCCPHHPIPIAAVSVPAVIAVSAIVGEGRSGQAIKCGRCQEGGAGKREGKQAQGRGGEKQSRRPPPPMAADTNHEPVPVTSPQPAAAARSSCGRRRGRRPRRPGLPLHRGSRCA